MNPIKVLISVTPNFHNSPMKKLVLFIGLAAAILQLDAKENRDITLEKIYKKGTFSAKSVYGLRSMEDGEHYTVLETVEGVQQINKYAYSKEKMVSTILNNDLKDENDEAIRIEGYQFSKDESKLLIKSKSERIYRHSMRSAYYLYDINSSKLQRIGDTKFQLAEFSPDGKWISFVRENNLYVYNTESKNETAVTTDGEVNKIINGAPDWVYEEEFTLVKAYEWSHDSKCIAYYKFDESNVKEFSFPVYGNLYPKNYVYKYPKAGEENSKVKVKIYHLEGKEATVNTQYNYEYIPRIQWVPSNDMLSIQFMNRLQNEVIVELVDRDNGTSNTLHMETSDTYVEVQDIHYLKGKNAFFWLSEANGNRHIYYYEYDPANFETNGGAPMTGKRVITEGSDVITNLIGYNEEDQVVYYQMADKWNPTDRQTMIKPLIEMEDLPEMPMVIPGGNVRLEPSKGLKYFVVYASAVYQPTIVAIHNNQGHPVRVLEDNKALNDTLSNYQLSRKEFFKFKNRNGDELVGWMIKPPNFDPAKKYPVLMYVYGGPGSQTVLNRWEGANYMWYQYLARKGYIIASVDNRGTGARPREFRTCTYGQLGKLETEDQIDAALYFAKENFVDEKRIGIWGWSYGGYMSTLCLAKGADVFSMAIAVAPVTNWRFYDTIYTERYMGLPKENGKSYDDNSPINHVDKIKGKYLLVHGTADDNVHFQNSAELISALVENNVQFEQAIYPNKNHGIYGGNTRYHLFKKMTDFIEDNL